MSTAYYSKELPDNPIYINGQAMRFDILATQDPVLIRHLDSAASKHIGGVVKLTQAQYEAAAELKKKAPSPTFSAKRHQREEVKQKLIPGLKSRGAGRAAVAVDNTPVPEEVKEATQNLEQFRPKTSKGILN